MKFKGLVISLGVGAAGTGCGGDQASVSYSFFEEPGFSVELVLLEFSDGDRTRRLKSDDFVGAAGSRRDSGIFETSTAGELVTSFSLVQGSDTLASGELRIDLRRDWAWSISFLRVAEDPSATCFGCIGSMPYALSAEAQSTPADSLWLVWGGNSISNPVVF